MSPRSSAPAQEFHLPPNPLVSVIIPAYNAEKFICDALDSVLAQTYSNLEIILVDDGSIDNTKDLVLTYGNKVLYSYQSNSGGCSKPRNEGIKRSRGQLICVFDADDIMLPHRVEDQVRCLREYPAVGMVISDYQNFDDVTVETTTHFETCEKLKTLLRRADLPEVLLLNPDLSTSLMLAENFLSAGGPMYRREVFDSVGGYDENLNASEDFEFHYRVASASVIGVLNKVGFRRRLHDSNMTRNSENILHFKIASRQKLLARETYYQNRRALRRMIGDLYQNLAYFYSGIDSKKSIASALRSLRYRSPFNVYIIKTVAKTLLSVAGLLSAKRK